MKRIRPRLPQRVLRLAAAAVLLASLTVVGAGPAEAHGTHRDYNFVYAGTKTVTSTRKVGEIIIPGVRVGCWWQKVTEVYPVYNYKRDHILSTGTVTTNEQRIGNAISRSEGVPYPGSC